MKTMTKWIWFDGSYGWAEGGMECGMGIFAIAGFLAKLGI
jgi:hypothetical protein